MVDSGSLFGGMVYLVETMWPGGSPAHTKISITLEWVYQVINFSQFGEIIPLTRITNNADPDSLKMFFLLQSLSGLVHAM